MAKKRLDVLKLTKLSPQRPKEGGLSPREKYYRQLLKSVSVEQRRKFMAKRKAISRARKKLINQIELSVLSVASKHPNFKGIFLFGGIPRGKKHPKDLDYMAVFEKHAKATFGEDRKASMLLWNKLEDLMLTHYLGNLYFEAPAGFPHKLENTRALRRVEKRRGVYPWDFIGEEQAKERIIQIFEKLRREEKSQAKRKK